MLPINHVTLSLESTPVNQAPTRLRRFSKLNICYHAPYPPCHIESTRGVRKRVVFSTHNNINSSIQNLSIKVIQHTKKFIADINFKWLGVFVFSMRRARGKYTRKKINARKARQVECQAHIKIIKGDTVAENFPEPIFPEILKDIQETRWKVLKQGPSQEHIKECLSVILDSSSDYCEFSFREQAYRRTISSQKMSY